MIFYILRNTTRKIIRMSKYWYTFPQHFIFINVFKRETRLKNIIKWSHFRVRILNFIVRVDINKKLIFLSYVITYCLISGFQIMRLVPLEKLHVPGVACIFNTFDYSWKVFDFGLSGRILILVNILWLAWKFYMLSDIV